MSNETAACGGCVLVVVVIAVMVCLSGLITMLVWNGIMVPLWHVQHISYGVALAFTVINSVVVAVMRALGQFLLAMIAG